MQKTYRAFAIWLALLLLLGAVPVQASATTVTARYYDDAGGEEACDFVYDDAYFMAPSEEYNHALACCSLGLALSAGRAVTAVDMTQKDKNIRSFFADAGFENFVSAQYDILPTIDTVGTAIASRKIGTGEDAFTLVALAIRGEGYQDEWLNNLSIGGEGVHKGFASAAEKTLQRLYDYLETKQISGRVKLWSAGHSRSGAISNLVGAAVIEAGVLQADDVFVYTFGTPNTTQTPKAYPQIFNILNAFDPTGCFPFREWGYGRHGITLYLPSREADGDFGEKEKRADAAYMRITGGEHFWANSECRYLLQKGLELAYGCIQSSESYERDYQSIVLETWRSKGGMRGKLRTILGMVRGNVRVLKEMGAVKAAFWNIVEHSAYNASMEMLGIQENEWNNQKNLKANVMHEHFPRVYVAWMLSTDDPDALFCKNQSYKRVIFSGDFDVRVYAEDGALVLTLENDGAAPVKRGDLAAFRIGEETFITLSGDREYAVELTARGDMRAQLGVRSYMLGGMPTGMLLSPELDLAAGEVLHLRVPRETAPDAEQLVLARGSESVPLAEIDAPADTPVDVMADLTLSGNEAAQYVGSTLLTVGLVYLPHVLALVLIVAYTLLRFGVWGGKSLLRAGKEKTHETL